ncbi:MAG TPA: methyltransferase [Steroidobacteraceae bacterium]|nr:methyltransferase [Steroidobacteraceae bacterium]
MPASDFSTRLLGNAPQSLARNIIGKMLGLANRITGRYRYDTLRLEHVCGVPLLILPTVFNPRLLRTGEYFASVIAGARLGAGGDVLDMGTGSGICAVLAARQAHRVVAVDINRAAVHCARMNAALNHHEERIECRQGDLFAPLDDLRFDTVFFNPPFIVGTPANERDCAWRSADVAARFAAGLARHLTSGGRAYLLLSTFGDACGIFVDELGRHGFALSVFAVRQYVNERVTILEARPPALAAEPT